MMSLWTLHVYSAFLAAIIDLLSVLVVAAAASERRFVLAHVAVATAMAAWCLGIGLQSIPGFRIDHPFLASILPLGQILLPAVALHTAGTWSNDNPYQSVRHRVAVGYVIVGFLSAAYFAGWIYTAPIEHAWGTYRNPGRLFVLHLIFAVACIGLGMAWCVKAARYSIDPRIRRRATLWIIGVVSLVPLLCMDCLFILGINVPPMGSIGNMILVTLWASATLRYRVFEMDSIVLRTSTVLIGTVAVTGAGTLALVVWHDLPLAVGSTLVSIPFAFSGAAAVVFSYRYRGFLHGDVECVLLSECQQTRNIIRQLSAELLSGRDYTRIAEKVTSRLRTVLNLAGVGLYRRVDGKFRLEQKAGNIALPEAISHKAIGALTDTGTGTQEIYVPIESEGITVGYLALGPRVSGAVVDDSGLALVSLIAGHLGTAWRNLDHIQEIQRQKGEIQKLHHQVETEKVVPCVEVRCRANFPEIIGASPPINRVLQIIERVAQADTSVLILGETGTGKELIARAIHNISGRAQHPLICVNCPAIPTELAESELFGHERGAFTGATGTRIGKLEMADNGTLFLDEVGDLPMSIQVKLLRALQEHEIERIGGGKTIKLNLRVMAATNHDLQAAVATGQFREDLYFRLRSVQIDVPPLRERAEDIQMLAAYFLERANFTHQKQVQGFTAEAISLLESHNWPGNIRELQNVVEHAVLLCPDGRIRPEQLGGLTATTNRPASSLSTSIRAEKRRRVEVALARSYGNQAAAARSLGMSRSNFGRLMKNLGLHRKSHLFG